MKVWVTKYALTKGILCQEVEDCGEGMVKTTDSWAAYYHKNEWHKTREAAVVQAEDMRKRKLASLEKQIAKLEKLRF